MKSVAGYTFGMIALCSIFIVQTPAWAQQSFSLEKPAKDFQPPSNDSMAPPPPPPHEPPPQAYEDCKGKKEGDALKIYPPGAGEVSATCVSSPKGLFARPDHPPEPPPGMGQEGNGEFLPPMMHEPPPQAYEDCKGRKEGDLVQIHPPGMGSVPATCTNSPKGLFARPEHPPGPPPGMEPAGHSGSNTGGQAGAPSGPGQSGTQPQHQIPPAR